MDVVSEFCEERAWQSADEVLNGDDPGDCIACHTPTAVLSNGGMSEQQALEYFFTTENGKFTEDTAPVYSNEWPDVSCTLPVTTSTILM